MLPQPLLVTPRCFGPSTPPPKRPVKSTPIPGWKLQQRLSSHLAVQKFTLDPHDTACNKCLSTSSRPRLGEEATLASSALALPRTPAPTEHAASGYGFRLSGTTGECGNIPRLGLRKECLTIYRYRIGGGLIIINGLPPQLPVLRLCLASSARRSRRQACIHIVVAVWFVVKQNNI